jgi:hypothetical protein
MDIDIRESAVTYSYILQRLKVELYRMQMSKVQNLSNTSYITCAFSFNLLSASAAQFIGRLVK